MATLLVFSEDNTHPTQDWGCWKQGYIVDVLPDGSTPEPPASGSKLWFIHVPGVSVDTFKSRLAQVGQDDSITRRRRYRINFASVPPATLSELEANKEVTIANVATVDGYFEDLEA